MEIKSNDSSTKTQPKPISGFKNAYKENELGDFTNLNWKKITEIRKNYPKNLKDQYIYAIKNNLLEKLNIKILTSDDIKENAIEPETYEYEIFKKEQILYYQTHMTQEEFDNIKDEIYREILYDYKQKKKEE